jgi:hypothetical protein
MLSASAAYDWLTRVGQIAGVASEIAVRGRSRLTWLGGTMPPGGPSALPEAERDLAAWVTAGAPNN